MTSNILYVNLNGGIGQQMFTIFNLLNLSQETNSNYYIYYKNNQNNFKIFDKLPKHDVPLPISHIIKVPNFKHTEIKLNEFTGKTIELSGYFQSHKYFWKNIDYIKDFLNIDYNKISEINAKYSNFKPVISIHVRFKECNKLKTLNIDYYKKALSYYNLNNYKIILFSDDIIQAQNFLEPLKIDYMCANKLYTNSEDHFYMLMLSKVIINSNSAYSLAACYLNEMYNFKNDTEYILPSIWCIKSIDFKINHFKLNYKFFDIDYKNIKSKYTKKYDVMTTLHVKDKERYKKFLMYNKKFLLESNNFYYISYKQYNDLNATHIKEKEYPFSKKDVINYIKDCIPNYRWGWYYQQLLKLYCFKINISKSDYILMFDSDILFLKSINLFSNNRPTLFKRNTQQGKVHKPYLMCQKNILPNLNYDDTDSGICHFMLLKKNFIENMLNEIELIHKKPAWKCILDGVKTYIKQHNYDESILSEYEMYYNYIKQQNFYEINQDFNYLDKSLKIFDINDENNKKYIMIADHSYQNHNNENDWQKVNLIEETLIKKRKKRMLKNFKINNIPQKENLYYQIVNLFRKYNCNLYEDRIKIIEQNKKINNTIKNNKIYSKTKYSRNTLKHIRNDLKQNFKYADYSKYNILCNKNGSLKNHILLVIDKEDFFDEIILNVNYTIISNNLQNYEQTKPLNMYIDKINEIEYIIYKDSKLNEITNHIKNLENKTRLDLFLSTKIPLLQICDPTFENMPSRLKNHYETNTNFDIFWSIKLDNNLCKKFIKNNFKDSFYLCYSLIYSISLKIDLVRLLFLYKFGGLYLDLSVKILNNQFLDFLQKYKFLTSRDEDYNLLQNGILYFKNKKSIICQNYIVEIISGVLNFNCNKNNKCSFLFNQDPSSDAFFYGPTTLFKIYDKIIIKSECKLLNTYVREKKKVTENHFEFNSISIDKNDNKEYLQVKYIGYNEDIRNFTKNSHYSFNCKNGLHFNSPLNFFDKILIINLKHRTDRKNKILQELNRFLFDTDKILFIDAVYNKENGALGCTASHIKCIQYAIKNNLDNILILEDDYNFCHNTELFNIELSKFLSFNSNWSALLLNISEHGPPINLKTNINNVYINLWSNTTAAYAVKKHIFKDLLNNFQNSLNSDKGPIDFHWNNLRIKYNWYVNKNILGYQRESYSDIENKIVKYRECLNDLF
jgi:glycosyl transferase family 25